MDGEIAGFKPFRNETAENDPGTARLSGQNVFNRLALRLIRPLVNIKRLGPASRNHQLGGVVKDDDIETIEDNLLKLALVDMDRPVSHAPLMGTELSVRNVPVADDLTVAILKKKSFRPPSSLSFCGLRHHHPSWFMKMCERLKQFVEEKILRR
jgi:hypothetical protein